MGVQGLWRILEPTARPIRLETLAQKRLAVDASIWIYHFLKAVRDKEGEALRNAHLVGFFRRICKLLFHGIQPVFVFDGGAPALKRRTLAARAARRAGRREDAVRAAGKLLALQMRRHVAEERERQRRGIVHETIPADAVYYGQHDDEQPSGGRPFRKKDQYHLPDLAVSFDQLVGTADDPRVMTREELREYAGLVGPSDLRLFDFAKIDYDSAAFRMLPQAEQYRILSATRLRSRLRMGLSYEQLAAMFPDRIEFSKFQIERVRERNELTTRLNNLNEANNVGMPNRIASDRGREYVLVKNSSAEGGYVLGTVDDPSPIVCDAETAKPDPEAARPNSSDDDDPDDDEFENVPIATVSSLPLPDEALFHSEGEDWPESDHGSPEQPVVGHLSPVGSHGHAHETTYDMDNRKSPVPLIDENGRQSFETGLANVTTETRSSSTKLDTFAKLPFTQLENPMESPSARMDQAKGKGPSSDAETVKTAKLRTETPPVYEPIKKRKRETASPSGRFIFEEPSMPNHLAQDVETSLGIDEIDIAKELVEEILMPTHLAQDAEASFGRYKSDIANEPVELIDKTIAVESTRTVRTDEPISEVHPTTSKEDAHLAEDKYMNLEEEEEEALLAQLAQEAEEHARFASEFNQRSVLENQEEFDREMRALRNQQRKDRRDADEINQIMVTECQQLLSLFGIPYIVAPMEAEAQCVELFQLGLVDGIVTDDSDVFLFGGTKIYKNMFSQKKYVECYLLADIERELRLSRERCIELAHLLGSDYTEGVSRIGPVLATEILSDFGNLETFRDWWVMVQQSGGRGGDIEGISAIRRRLARQSAKIFLPTGFPDRTIDEAYLKPVVDSDPQPFEWGSPDLSGLRAFLMRLIGWTAERTDQILLPIIRDMNRRKLEGGQSNITRFMRPEGGGAEGFAPRRTVRR